jgi:hypothetical protein
MPNTFLTPSVFAAEGLRILENELVLGNFVHTDLSKEYEYVGNTVSVRRPTSYLGQQNNLDITAYREDIIQGRKQVTLDQTISIPVDIGAIDKTLNFDRISEDVIKPVMVRMKDIIERDIARTYTQAYWFAGTPGTVPTTFAALAEVGGIMTDAAIPQSGRAAFHSPEVSWRLADGLRTVFPTSIASNALQEASIGRYAGFDNYTTVHAPTHTVGVNTGTPVVNLGSQNVTYDASKDTWSQTLNTRGWTNSTANIVRAGDVFTIANVFAVNPITKTSTGRLQTFTVLADASSGATTGPAALTISPPIITSGAYQTVTAVPADGATITVRTGTGGVSYRQSLLMAPKAIALVSRPLNIANGAGVKTSTRMGNKVTISVTEFINGNTLAHTMRFDMLYKADMLDPRQVARLTS